MDTAAPRPVSPNAPGNLDAIIALVRGLEPGQLALVGEMVRAMNAPIERFRANDSDIVTELFESSFANRLLIHHAVSEHPLNKKLFEYAFCEANRAAGRVAVIVSSQTNPGKDVVIDGVPISLKTEGSKSIDENKLTISKLMEARWIRDCRTEKDFVREATSRIGSHLGEYKRIFILRVFSKPPVIQYDLVELPLEVLQAIQNVKAIHFRPRTKNGGTSAPIAFEGKFYRLVLDGSVEKVTVSGLPLSLCRLHGSWKLTSSLLKETAEEPEQGELPA